MQLVVHVAVDRLPAYAGAQPGDHHGLQSYVDELDELTAAFRAAEDRRVHLPAPAYAFTTSALDGGLAPPGHHTVYLACPAAPFDVRGGWERAAPAVVRSMLDQVEARAPGFQDTIQGVAVRTPELMASELRWPGAHPMVLDVTLGPARPLRPTAALASHRDAGRRACTSAGRGPRRPAASPGCPAAAPPEPSSATAAARRLTGHGRARGAMSDTVVGRVAALWRYPVKSMAAEGLEEVEVSWHGLAGDRRWAFVRDGLGAQRLPVADDPASART